MLAPLLLLLTLLASLAALLAWQAYQGGRRDDAFTSTILRT